MYTLLSTCLKMLENHYWYHHFADEDTEAQSGSVIVQGQHNLMGKADLELSSRPDAKAHILLCVSVCVCVRMHWTMKDPILDIPVSSGPQILLSVALFILVIDTL